MRTLLILALPLLPVATMPALQQVPSPGQSHPVAMVTLVSIDPHYEKSVGDATEAVVTELADRTFSRNAFILQSETVTPAPQIHRETQWREREPYEDEAAQGVVKARNRMIVRSRGRGNSGGASERSRSSSQMGSVRATTSYRIRFTIENQVMLVVEDGWTEIDATEQFEEWAKRIVSDFEADLRARR